MPIDESRAFCPVRIAVLTVSDTRSLAEDRSGDTLVARLTTAGHETRRPSDRARRSGRDRRAPPRLDRRPRGRLRHHHRRHRVTGRDVTPEAVERVADKMIPGFGELFRWLSYAKIGASTVQSRACACVARGTYIFALPGSTGAVKDGWDGILATQLDIRHTPCNFVELMPRLMER